MGFLGRGTSWRPLRGTRYAVVVVAIAVAVVIVSAAPLSADSTGISIAVVNSVATEGGTAATFEVSRVGDAPLTDVDVTNVALTGDTSRVASVTPAAPFTLSDANPTEIITVTANNDNTYQGPAPGTFNLSLTPSVGSAQGTSGTIVDNDSAPTISINDPSSAEGNSGSHSAPFTVTLTRPASQQINVVWSPGTGTATPGQDFSIAAGGTLVFAPGEITESIPVAVNGDAAPESDESYVVNLTSATSPFVITKTQGTGTIVNDDAAPPTPTLSIGDLTVDEGVGTAVVKVTLSAASTSVVTVNATTSDGSAVAPGDYAAGTIPVTIPAGQTSGDVPIPIANDAVDEATETFSVKLSGPINATIADDTAAVTITDNDSVSALAVNDVSVTEPSTGTVNAVFTVTLSPRSDRTVTVPYSVAPGTATPSADYTATSGSLTFAPGDLSKTVTVVVIGDAVNEANETFTLTLGTPSGAKIGDGDGQGLIVDPSAPPALTIADGTVDEGGGTLALVVTLSGNASAQTITVDYAAASGTATAGVDFAATTGQLSFAPGTTSKTIAIPITNDAIGEADETFSVTISNPVGATIAKSRANVRLVDNDPVPGGGGGGGGGTLPKPPPTTTPTPKPLTPPVTTVRLLQARVLSAKLAGKVEGRRRVAIRLTLNQSVTAKITMVQGKRKLTSTGFPVKFGNRTVYVILPAFVKPGKVQFQVNLTPVKGSATTLKTFVTIKPPPVKKS